MVIIINGLAGRLFGSLEQRADINIETQIREGRGDDLLAAVVAVLTELGDQDTGPTPLARQELLDPLPDFRDCLGAIAKPACVYPAHRVYFGFVPAEDLFQGITDFTHSRPCSRRDDGQLQQVSLA